MAVNGGRQEADDHLNWMLKLNLSIEDMNLLLNLTQIQNNISSPNSTTDDDEGQYCNGTLRDIATSYRNVHGYISLIICTFGTLANLVNIIVLTGKRIKGSAFAQILTWLAIADMLLMLEYIPFVCFMYLRPTHDKFSYNVAVYMLLHTHVSQTLHTISICLTLTLAFCRYNAIRYPEKSRNLWSKEKCKGMIILSIILPLLICCPSYFMFSIQSTEINHDEGTNNNNNNTHHYLYHLNLSDLAQYNDIIFLLDFWMYAVVIKLLPCIILAFVSYQLIIALRETTKRKENLYQIETCEKQKTIKKTKRKIDRSSHMLIAILFLFLVTEFPQFVLGLLSGLLGKIFFLNCYHLLGEMMDLLALLNGAINFILYCTMSKQFRLTFSKIFRNIFKAQLVTNI